MYVGITEQPTDSLQLCVCVCTCARVCMCVHVVSACLSFFIRSSMHLASLALISARSR